MRFLGTVLLLAACASSSPPAPATPPASAEPAATPVAASAPAEDPERRLGRDECNQALDHVIAMPTDSPQAKDVITAMKANRDQFLERCLSTARKKHYDCLMTKTTFQELGTCAPPGE